MGAMQALAGLLGGCGSSYNFPMQAPEFACFACGRKIDAKDREAVQLAVSNLWIDDGGVQALHAHARCAIKVLNRKGHFDPTVLIE